MSSREGGRGLTSIEDSSIGGLENNIKRNNGGQTTVTCNRAEKIRSNKTIPNMYVYLKQQNGEILLKKALT